MIVIHRICLSAAATLNVFAALADPNPLRILAAVGLGAAAGFAFGRQKAPTGSE